MFVFDILAFLLGAILVMGITGVIGMADWILSHLGIVFFLLILKSLLLMGSGFFEHNDHPSYYVTLTLIILADVIRNGVFLYFASLLLAGLFEGTLFDLILQLFVVLVGGSMLLFASEGPMYLVYDLMDDPTSSNNDPPDMSCFWLCVGLEAVSIAAMLLVYFIFLK